jgi:sporulation integral membrane protein YtvI
MVVTTGLVILKIFTYFFQDFMPAFSKVISRTFSVFLPFVMAFILALLLEPLVVRLMRAIHIRRPYAAALALLLALFVSSLFVFLLVNRLYAELSELAITFPNFSFLADFVSRQVDIVEKFVKVNPQIQSTLTTSTETLATTLQEWAKSGSMFLLGFLTALPGIFIVMIVSLVATLMMSSSLPNVKQFLANLFPPRWQVSVQAVSHDLGAAGAGYLRAQAILMSVTGFITITGLLLFGNRYAVILGIIAGLLDVVPIVGTGILFGPWIVGLLIMGLFGEGFKVIFIWAITLVLRRFLEPKIMSQGLGLEPLPTLISMYVGLQLLGIGGILIGPAVVISYEALRKVGVFGPPDS